VEAAADLDRLFPRQAPRYVEVGFGDGEALLALAQAHPERDYLGIEVYPPGIGRLLAGLQRQGLDNVRVLRADAAEVFAATLPEGSLAGVYVWFPDPWPKRRHHKRRLIQPAFAAHVTRRLRPGGIWHLATDWQEYAEQMLSVLAAEPGLVNLDPGGRWFTGPTERPITKFQRRGERLGQGTWDLLFRRRT
jgi:tRNA (guanine-N7-)-methyltransferase